MSVKSVERYAKSVKKEKCDEFVLMNINKYNSLKITRGVHFVQIRAYNNSMVGLFIPSVPSTRGIYSHLTDLLSKINSPGFSTGRVTKMAHSNPWLRFEFCDLNEIFG